VLELTKQEWKKILRIKAVPLLLYIMFFFALLSYGKQLFPQNTYSVKAYRAAHDSLDSLTMDSLEEKQSELEKESLAMLFSQTLPEDAFTGYFGHEFELYGQLIAELEQVTGYERYLAGVHKNAQKTQSSTLHMQQEASLKEAEKIIRDFAIMEKVQPKFFPVKGMDLFFEMDLQDFVLVLAVFMVAVALATVELEEGTIRLLRCTDFGRNRVVYAKWLAGSGILTGYWFLLCGLRFLITAGSYGTRCMSGNIVALKNAWGCTLPITIGQGVILFCLGKWIALLALFSLILVLSLVLQKGWRIYLFAGGTVAVFWMLYALIDEYSWLAPLKWLNPVAFLDTGALLLQYRNITVFGCPLTYRNLMLVICVTLIFIVLLCLKMAFLVQRYGGVGNGNNTAFAVTERVVVWSTGRYAPGGFELRKWSFYQSGGVVLLILATLLFVTYTPVADQMHTEDEVYYRYYVKEVEGVWEKEKMESLYKERDKLSRYKDILNSGEADDGAASYYRQQLKRENGLQKVIQYGEYLEEKADSTFLYEQGYERLFGKREPMNLFLYRALSLAVVVFLSVQLYGVERYTGMNRLIRISAIGEKKVRGYKWINTLLIGSVTFSVVFVPWFYNVFSVYGTYGLTAPVYCLWQLGIALGAPVYITVWMALAVYYGAYLLYLCFVGFVSGFVAVRIKNPLIASLAAFGTGVLPLLSGLN